MLNTIIVFCAGVAVGVIFRGPAIKVYELVKAKIFSKTGSAE